jgi:hypothetical protein
MRKRWKLASVADVADVVSRLRIEDIEECRAMWGVSPASFFATHGYDKDNTYVIFNSSGRNVALAGVAPTKVQGSAQIWMIATDDLLKHQIEFLRYSKPFIDEISAPYSIIYNWVDARNEVHIKWLKWCGFIFIDKKERWGAAGLPFYEFLKVN